MRTEVITIAGFNIETTIDKDKRLVSTADIERLLRWRLESTREKLRSKSLKAFAGKALTPVKKKRESGGSDLNMLTTEDFSLLVIWEATRGNPIAAGLVTATLAEAVNRRIDDVFNVGTTNVEFEEQTRDFFRELARKSFHPELTASLKDSVKGNWGRAINEFKVAAGLPKTPVETWGKSELELWVKAMNRYNCLRDIGKTHKQSLKLIGYQRIDREVSK